MPEIKDTSSVNVIRLDGPAAGMHVKVAAMNCVALANINPLSEFRCDFNGTDLVARAGDSAEDVVAAWSAEMDRKRIEYEASPEYAAQQAHWREENERRAKRDREIDALIADVPLSLAPGKEDDWAEAVSANADSGYGASAIRYTERWARLMQVRIAAGATVESCAKDASHDAENEGITGFQHGCAVSLLADCWIHGEALRRWHNIDCQIGHEGEIANASGGVLNPAILILGAKS